MAGDRVLVTGGAGMIGSSLVKRLATEGFRVTVADNLWRGRISNLLRDDGQPAVDLSRDFHEVDLAVPGACDALVAEADYVFHLADVVAGIGYVFSNEGSIFHGNLLINSNVIAAARKARLRGFVYVGTACSYPAVMQWGVEAPPLKEEDAYPAAPESAYGWSKLMGEYETLLFEKEAGVPVSVLRLHNVYGSPCDFDERAQVIPALVRKAIRYPAEPFVVWGSGAQGRAFIHVRDVVDALVATLDKGLGQGVIQVGPDVCTSIAEIAAAVVEISGKPIEVVYDTTRPEGDRGRCADYSKAERLLGWTPRVSLRDGLRDVYRWIERRLEEETERTRRMAS